ncbi:MAG: regulatory iron-sulfur-containing complex subunit RicT [Elusimicrobiota bacterium]|nr:regulatory iron-sulfur-containing complex subunit RicT [Elusimicrobiota bacterium]
MPIIVDLVIRKKPEIVLGDVGELDLSIGDKVIVDIDNTQELALVSSKERLIEKPKKDVYKILRKFTEEDNQRLEHNKLKAQEVKKTVLQKIEDYEISMKLISVEYSFDRTKLFIYYTAETRIDFRQLIKELGHMLKTRIQMVQIGARDAAKILSGIGPCGRIFCCCLFLKNFSSVSVEMAKIQDPTQNITKLSGPCGRLFCCLAFESEFYSEQEKKLPAIDSKIQTPDGLGRVIAVHYIKEEVTVELSNKQIKKFRVRGTQTEFVS